MALLGIFLISFSVFPWFSLQSHYDIFAFAEFSFGPDIMNIYELIYLLLMSFHSDQILLGSIVSILAFGEV